MAEGVEDFNNTDYYNSSAAASAEVEGADGQSRVHYFLQHA